ncbi:MAG: stage II sporulation protein M, partial [Candidatus Methanoperedens sp.]
MNKQIINKFYGNIKNVLTMEKLKENLKLPVYAYIISFVLGIIAVIVIVLLLKPDMSGGVIKPEKFGQITNGTLITEGTWSDIIKHNISILIFLFISGIVLYIGPILILGINGFFHGLLLGLSILGFGGMGLVKYLALMGPHGIFELPALFFSAGAGILLSKELWHIATSYYFF